MLQPVQRMQVPGFIALHIALHERSSHTFSLQFRAS
jgi:hypothetical protein